MEYEGQARELLEAFRSGDSDAIGIIHHRHPRFLDPKFPWLPKRLSDDEIRAVALEIADAQLAIARWYDFRDWEALADYVEAVTHDGPVFVFESAVEAVIAGDLAVLESLLRNHPDVVRARSTRVTHFDPPVHGARLLHYVAANGVEGYRQKTPGNAAEVAKMLLEAGAEPDALACMCGGQCTAMSLLVSSSHPKNAGVEIPLVNLLVDYGAAVDGRGSGNWVSPLMTALVFWHLEAAEALVRRGARVETLAAAAGLGRVKESAPLLPAASEEDRHRAIALAAQLGHVEIVRLLLEAGEDPNRYNPEGIHSHSTPLHQAVFAGHFEVVQLLVEHGARLDIKDTVWQGTPLGWAEYCGRPAIADYLRGLGAA